MVFSLHSAQNRTKHLFDELIKNEIMHKSVKYLVTVEAIWMLAIYTLTSVGIRI